MAHRVDELIRQLTSGYWATRYDACKQLGESGDVRGFEPLLQRLGDEDCWVRAAARKALGKLGDARASNAIIQLTLQEALERPLPAQQQGDESGLT